MKTRLMRASSLAGIVIIVGIIALVASCGKRESRALSLGVFAGPTGISVAQVLDESPEYGGGDFLLEYQLFSTPPEVIPFLVRGELDMVTLPLNLGIKLYNEKSIPYKLAAVTGTGMLQVITRDPGITSFQDLEKTTVYGAGKGGSPELIYTILTEKGGISSSLDFTYNAPVQLVAALMEGLVDTALIPEPFATKLLANPELRVVVDMEQQWQQLLGESSTYPMTGLFVLADTVDSDPKVVGELLKDVRESILWVVSNPEEAAPVIEQLGIMKAALVQQAIPNLELTYIDGAEAEIMVSSYVDKLLEYAPASVGGAMPD